MFFLDKLVLDLIIAKCTQVGAAFFLDPSGGAAIIVGVIGYSIITGIDMSTRKSEEKKK